MVVGIVLVVLFVFCSGQIANNYRIMEKQLDTVQILMADPVEASFAYQMAKQGNNQVSGQEIVFWTQELMETVSSPDLGNRSIQTEVVALCGKSSILFDSSFGLEYSDNNCCLLSHGASYELFGIKEVKGTTIIYNGDEYTIVGSIPTDNLVMAYEVAKDSNILFDMAVIDNRAEKTPDYLLEQFGVRWGAYAQTDRQQSLQYFLQTEKGFWEVPILQAYIRMGCCIVAQIVIVLIAVLLRKGNHRENVKEERL